MSRRCLVVGGFEPSGHDTTEEAVVESGRARGHAIEVLRWRDLAADLGTHPMFTSHRYAAAQGAASIAGLLDEDWIVHTLAQDLASRVPLDFDTYVSVHPWSSIVCAEALARAGIEHADLIDYTSEFSQFPLVVHERVSAFLGGGAIRPLEPRYRARSHVVGVAVPRRFQAASDGRREARLVVSGGADGWAIGAMLPSVSSVVRDLTPDDVVLLAPTANAAIAWERHEIANARIVEGMSDISKLLRESRWYLSKGGGTAVAEGLVAGCDGYVSPSGVFWEDDACAGLAARGVITLAGRPPQFDEEAQNDERHRCTMAASRVWELVEGRAFLRANAHEVRVIDSLIERIDVTAVGVILPQTTSALRKRLDDWRIGWSPHVKA